MGEMLHMGLKVTSSTVVRWTIGEEGLDGLAAGRGLCSSGRLFDLYKTQTRLLDIRVQKYTEMKE